MKYIGGYSILDLTDANVSAQANACYNQDKPVLVYGANGERYFADTITKDGTNIIVTKGGKTITIANDNTITNVGDVQVHLYNYTFLVSNSDSDDVYLSYKLPKLFNNPKELLDYVGENVNSYEVVGVAQSSNITTISAISTIVYLNDEHSSFEIYSLFDDEAVFGTITNIPDTFMIKKQIF